MRLPLAALVLASATLASSAFADDSKAKPKGASHHPHKPKAHASLPKKPLPSLPKSEAAKPKPKSDKPDKNEKSDKSDKKDPSKVDKKDDDQPPEELSGHLAQAKIADKKKKKDDAKKDDAKKDEKPDPKKKLLPPNGKKSAALPPVAEFQALQKKIDKKKMKSCLNPAVSFARLGQATDVTFALTTCDGGAAPGAVENLSILARPYDVPAPSQPQPLSILALPKKGAKPNKALSMETNEIAPGIRRVDPGLVMRLQAIADKFPGRTITLVSGYRPMSKGSPHQAARAFDIRIDGVTNESLVAFCKTLKDTGCGYYPNSYFVHVDVRPPGTGHVYWIDVSGPGEKPVYVKQWPPPLPAAKPQDAPKPADDGVTPTTDESTIGSLEDAEDEPSSKSAPTN